MTPDDRIRAARMRGQYLDGRAADAELLVRDVCGIQAQEPHAAALSIRARTHGIDAEAVRLAIEEERSVVRMWAMRGTIHLVAAEDSGWLHELFTPLAVAAQQRALDRVGVPQEDRARAVALIRDALAEHGPLTRAELCERLEHSGIDTAGQKAAYLPRLAALEGHVCFGPRRDGKDTYALTDDWVGESWHRGLDDRERALAELARRYLAAYAPAHVEDFAAWSGLGATEARAGFAQIASELEETDGGWLLRRDADRLEEPPPDPPLVRLVPTYDTYLLGYRNRDLAVPAEHHAQVWPGGGVIRPAVLVNGRAVATWRVTRAKSVEVEPFRGTQPPDTAKEIADVERFLGG